jgi:hypothetical protein
MCDELDPRSRHFPVWDSSDLAVVVAAVRSDLNEHPEQFANQRLDRYLEALQAWLVAYPLPYVDADRAVEDVGARFFADALLAARSGRITFGSV